MIVFELICPKHHRFEGWFASSGDFDSQQERGLLSCPNCGHAGIKKLPTAKIRKSAEVVVMREPEKDGGKQLPVATMPNATLNQLIDYVLANSEDVGGQFAAEARRIFRSEAPNRNIRGVASRQETEELLEEGVPVMPLPVPPREGWH